MDYSIQKRVPYMERMNDESVKTGTYIEELDGERMKNKLSAPEGWATNNSGEQMIMAGGDCML